MPPLNTPEKPEFPTDETLGERLTTVAFYTAISVSMSLCITLAILYFSGHGMHRITIIISIVAPGIIAPLVTWYVSDLLVRIARMEEKHRHMATFDELTEQKAIPFTTMAKPYVPVSAWVRRTPG